MQKTMTTPTTSEIKTLLDQLAAEANALYAKMVDLLRMTVHKAKAIGDVLNQAKQLVPHGDWTKWLQKNFNGCPEKARKCIRIAENWDLLKDEGVEDVDVYISGNAAIRIIAEFDKTAKKPRLQDEDDYYARCLAKQFAERIAEWTPAQRMFLGGRCFIVDDFGPFMNYMRDEITPLAEVFVHAELILSAAKQGKTPLPRIPIPRHHDERWRKERDRAWERYNEEVSAAAGHHEALKTAYAMVIFRAFRRARNLSAYQKRTIYETLIHEKGIKRKRWLAAALFDPRNDDESEPGAEPNDRSTYCGIKEQT
jgi:hypothetical protein